MLANAIMNTPAMRMAYTFVIVYIVGRFTKIGEMSRVCKLYLLSRGQT
jgi:hypothetical protein